MFSGFHVVDGGLGIEMIRHGLDIEDDPLWSAKGLIHYSNDIKNIHQSFLESGANIILTASYQASIDGFCSSAKCTPSKAKDLIKKSVQLAKEACATFLEDKGPGHKWSPLVGGSVGPYGACLGDLSEYDGNYNDTMKLEDIISWHRPRIEILIEAGVDFLAVETIPSLGEAEAIMHVIKEFPNMSCWITFSCKDDKHLCHGESFQDAAVTIAAYDQVKAVGVNCCLPRFVQGLMSNIREKVKKPLVVLPNTNKFINEYPPLSVTTHIIKSNYGHESASLASYVPGWLAQGVTIVGGCCGAGPSDIQAIRTVISDCTRT